jgi:branched-chain amino acid transport system substrate-binding protein
VTRGCLVSLCTEYVLNRFFDCQAHPCTLSSLRICREFVEAHNREYPGADLSFHAAANYGACQVLTEAVRRAGSPDREKIRDAILKLDFNTVFGAFKVDPGGFQIAHKLVIFQWQDGKKVIVWPEELAPGKPRFPTPPWNQRQ